MELRELLNDAVWVAQALVLRAAVRPALFPYCERTCLRNSPESICKLAVAADKTDGSRLTRETGAGDIERCKRVRRGERAECGIDMFVVDQLAGGAVGDRVSLSSSDTIQRTGSPAIFLDSISMVLRAGKPRPLVRA